MENTKYRLIPIKTYIGDMFLQFEDCNGNWRLIPKELEAYVSGKFLKMEDCPENIPLHHENYFMSSYYKNQEYYLIPFTKNYPSIEKYFDELIIKREKYLKNKEEKDSNDKIIYLQ